MRFTKFILSLFFLAHVTIVFGQDVKKVKSLFLEEDILEIKISMNVEEVIEDLEVRDYHEANIVYTKPDGATESIDLRVKVRGMTRANPKVCKFPPLRLNFKKKQVTNTLFKGQDKLKLVTHCNTKPINQEYVLREYYAYKIYQLVTPNSFNVRLCRITYEDTAGEYDQGPYYGFIIEDIDDLAKRNGMKEYKDSIRNQEVCNRPELDKLMLFEYLIGNLDWSVPTLHNFKLVAPKVSPVPVAVPYDFDYSGMVNTSYAKVPPGIDVPNVRTRVFRGLCRMEGGYDATLNYYQEIRPEIYAIYEGTELLSEKSKAYSIKYLDEFYKVLDNPKQFEQRVVKACRADHKHIYQY